MLLSLSYTCILMAMFMCSARPQMLSEDTGRELLDQMKQGDLRQYNTHQVGRANMEIQHVECKMDNLKHHAETSGITEELSVNFAMLKAYTERLTRISRAYHLDRLLKIEDNYFVKDDIRKFLCISEMEFDKDFNRCADDYLQEFKHLSLNDRSPPLSFYVQIQTLEDCGTVLCDDEFIDLKRDRIYFLKKADVAHLLKRKMARII